MAENEKEVIDVTPVEQNETKAQEVTPAADQQTTEQTKKEQPAKQEKPAAEKGFSHYVGFALLTFLAIIFFFIPGISVAYLINQVGTLSPAAAWIIAAVFSAIVWLIFKLKIKGWKRASGWYIGFCGLVFTTLLLVWQLAEIQVFGGIFGMLLP